MRLLKSIDLLIGFLFLSCIPSSPILSEKPGAPQFKTIKLTVRVDQFNRYSESVHLTWTPPVTDSVTIQSYTILRKFPGDSIFDQFELSQNIPSSIEEFYDHLRFEHFPKDGFDSLFYKIYAIDTYNRISDTSETYGIIIAPQPDVDTLITNEGCFTWESWIRGGQKSYGWFWNESIDKRFEGDTTESFPRTDEAAQFKACIPDSLVQLRNTRLNFALFINIVDIHSILVGYIDLK